MANGICIYQNILLIFIYFERSALKSAVFSLLCFGSNDRVRFETVCYGRSNLMECVVEVSVPTYLLFLRQFIEDLLGPGTTTASKLQHLQHGALFHSNLSNQSSVTNYICLVLLLGIQGGK